MALVNKIDSNVSGLRYAEESAVPKVLPGSPVWWPLEPNSYKDFGGQVTTVARKPISADRQNKKGVVTDLEAGGGFQTDITYKNLQDVLQGFFYADFRKKPEKGGYGVDEFTSVATSDDSYNATTGLANFVARSLIFASGFTNPGNNGLKQVATAAAGKITVTTNLTDESNPPSGAKIVQVGYCFNTGDVDIDMASGLPVMTSATLDLTTLGLIPGEWVFLGGDSAPTQFVTAANNGWKRIKTVAAGAITFDKSSTTMVTEANTTTTVHMYFGRLLINEVGTLIKRRTYQLERTLGVPDTDNPNDAQAEYILGAVPNEITFNFATADKLTADLTFMGMEQELVTAATGLKAGARPDQEQATGYNTSSDVSRVKMAVVDAATATPTALFAYITEAALTVNNNASANKVIGTIGAADVTAGNFEVSGTMTCYFTTVEALQAVKDNASVTLDILLVKENTGVVIDIPLLVLGEGRAQIEADQPITLPLGFDGAKSPAGYTLSMGFFDYLPDAADL